AVVMIGADCPHLPGNHLRDAFELLNDYDVVIGPSTDGGYYLIGMREELPPVFDGMPWSTPDVFSETIRRLALSDRSFVLLDESFDVDDITGLRQLAELLSGNEFGREYDELRNVIANVDLPVV
ncbi:MAG: DUF2064 domain-containing protein, partial [Pirellulales bacterium]|nr:DUF2064 domain-containing protein [Pirellulales bacterium]